MRSLKKMPQNLFIVSTAKSGKIKNDEEVNSKIFGLLFLMSMNFGQIWFDNQVPNSCKMILTPQRRPRRISGKHTFLIKPHFIFKDG